MIIGIPKEIKNNENRVGLIPAVVADLTARGHTVYFEQNAGIGSGLSNEEYAQAGGQMLPTAAEVFAKSDMIVKVKEPQPSEIAMLRPGQILFTYLHLAPDMEQTNGLMQSGCIAIAYETVEDRYGKLPLLTPMSEVAGRLSIQMGAHYLEKTNGGKGVLLSGVPGVQPAEVVIMGGGVSGTKAAKAAIGMGAHVTVFEKNLERMRYLSDIFQGKADVLMANTHNVINAIKRADLIVGAVLIPGAAAPKVITRDMLRYIQPGSVMVDISIDQGGCFETSRPTSHADPIYNIDGVIHYCVTNMPGAVPRTSTFALNNATYQYVMDLATYGVEALKRDPGFLKGLNTFKGQLTCEAVAVEQGREFVSLGSVLLV